MLEGSLLIFFVVHLRVIQRPKERATNAWINTGFLVRNFCAPNFRASSMHEADELSVLLFFVCRTTMETFS
jgi:hypothetical protein